MPNAILRLAVVTVLMGGLAACSQPSGGEATAVDAPPTEVVAVPTNEPISSTPADTLVFAHPEDALKLDPSDVTDSESLLATWHIYEGLTRYEAGTTEVEPALATEWTVSDDGLLWTFTLREGVMFHDGEPFNADAVVWNFDRWYDPANANHFAEWEFAYWGDMFQGFKDTDKDADGTPDSFLESVAKVDDTHVTLTLRRPNAPLLQTLAMGNFAFSSPTAVETSGASYGTPDGNPIAVGTGPYMLDSWVADDQIALSANPDYWGDAPATPKIILRKIPENTARFLALRSGDIDGMNQMNPEDIAAAQADTALKVVFEPGNNVGYLGFNQAHAPWGNVDCRKAVAHAIDKQGIVDGLHSGDAEVAKQMMPPSMWGYAPGLEDYAYDLDEAGIAFKACTDAETIPETVTLYVPPVARFYFPKPQELGEAVQANLASLGITTKIESPEWATYLAAVRAGKADLFLLGWGGDNGDPDNFLCVFFCGGDASWNSDAEGTGMPPSAELNTALREAATLSDQTARAAAYEEANVMIHDGILAVPLVHRTPPLGFSAATDGYVSSPIQTILTTVSKN